MLVEEAAITECVAPEHLADYVADASVRVSPVSVDARGEGRAGIGGQPHGRLDDRTPRAAALNRW